MHAVFKGKVLEAHRQNTYGEDDSSSSSSSTGGIDRGRGVSPLSLEEGQSPVTCKRVWVEGSPEEEAIGVMKRHREFLLKQQTLAKRYREGVSALPRTVSSRRQAVGKALRRKREKEKEGRSHRLRRTGRGN